MSIISNIETLSDIDLHRNKGFLYKYIVSLEMFK